jgi:murein DD-endopeptidase MepM/ murein hydrolase activator NlpD
MLKENWGEWSRTAGYRGANPHDPVAQDAVAGFWAQRFFDRYGSWSMASNAWYGGQDQADQLMREGREAYYAEYMQRFEKAVTSAQDQFIGAPVPISARRWINTDQSGKWINPIAGESEYSGGSWMPNTLTHRGRTHAAMDVYAKKGTPIVSPVSGVVKRVKSGNIGGNTVTIDGDDGVTYYFAHMAWQSELTVGSRVGAGNHVGYVGNSGSASSTSPHLHFSMSQGGRKINPKSYLDGSANGAGYFQAQGANHPMGQKPNEQLDTVLDHMIERISNGSVPGDQPRQDPRTIGLNAAGEKPVLADDQELGRPRTPDVPDAPREIVSEERGPY